MASTDPGAMLRHCDEWPSGNPDGHCPHRPSARKLRLFACACSRQAWDRLDNDARRVVAAAERDAEDGLPSACTANPLSWLLLADAAGAAGWAVTHSGCPPAIQAALARCVFGNPFRPVARCVCKSDLAPCHGDPRCPWSAVTTPAVLDLAAEAYRDRGGVTCGRCGGAGSDRRVMGLPAACPDCDRGRVAADGRLDPARLAVLCDALEENGATDAQLLAHLRGPGPHVRGCFACDALLGKT